MHDDMLVRPQKMRPLAVEGTACRQRQPVRQTVSLPPVPRQRGRVVIRIRLRVPALFWQGIAQLRQARPRAVAGMFAALVFCGAAIPVTQALLEPKLYALSYSEAKLLPKKEPDMANLLTYDASSSVYQFNKNPAKPASPQNFGYQKAQAAIATGGQPYMQVSDPQSGDTFKMSPAFALKDAARDSNRVSFALGSGGGHVTYSVQAGGVKEDITLLASSKNTQTFDYDISNGGKYSAELQSDGSVNIYANNSLPDNISTGSASDAALLQKMRQQSAKTDLVFTIPAPTVTETNRTASVVRAAYSVRDKGQTLRVTATNLKQAQYPLTIDPSVSVTSVSDVFRDMNPETNVDFDGATGNISRGAVTGGIIPGWVTNANVLGTARFLQSTAINDDYIYVAGGTAANSTTSLTSVEFAKIDSTGSSIGAWSTTTSLPAGLSRFRLTAYNGYLYAIGGSLGVTNCSTVSDAVYYNRIQVNGQLSAAWSQAPNLPAGLCSLGAAIYNGTMYVAGGKTAASPSTNSANVYTAAILPNGGTASWQTDDSPLPAGTAGANLRAYNGYLYLIGGTRNGTPTNQVLYAPIAANGSIYGSGSASWQATSSFATARSNLGASFSVVADGFIYIGGGCSTFNGSYSCTAPLSDVQIAQINADGTLGPWSPVQNVSLTRTGGSLKSWRGTLYSVAGCTSMQSASIACANSGTTVGTQSYSKISGPGELGPVTTVNAMPTAVFAHGAVVNNGYLYVAGGCVTDSCEEGFGDTTGKVSYAPINADGSLGTWTTDSTHLLNGSTGLAAFGFTVYNNVLYATGGYTSGGPKRNVWYVGLNDNGSLAGNWVLLSSKLSTTTYYNAAAAYRGFLYVFGGCIGTTGSAGCSTYRSQVWRMPINADGSLGTTVTGTSSSSTLRNLPTATALTAPAIYNGYMYLAGGATGSSGQTDTIRYARIQDNGNISSWSTATGHLAQTIRRGDAAAMNGYFYVFGGHNGNIPATYDYIQIGKIDLSSGNITDDFSISVTRISKRWDERAAYVNGHFYVTGGCAVGDPPNGCSSVASLDENVELFNAGNKGTSAWADNASTYATARTSTAAAVYNGYLYVAGGCTDYVVGTSFANSYCNAADDSTAYAPLNPDGSIGSWTTGPDITPSNARVGGCLAAIGGYLYYVGGENSNATAMANIRYSQIGSDGSPGTWTQTSSGLPAARAWMGCGTFAGRIYVTGGEDSTGTEQSSVYYSPDLSAGGDITDDWGTGTDFNDARAHHISVVAAGYLFVIGGDDGGTTGMIDVQSIQLDPSGGGTVGSWQYSSDLPQGVSYQAAFNANGYIYLYGGRTAATSCINNTYVASVNSTGRLSGWSQGVNNFTTARFGAAGAFYNGYYYLLGGDDCSNIVSSHVIQYGGEQSQAMKTLATKYLDMAGDARPQKFVGYLTNAQNNGVDIEKWQLSYMSSADAANTWGTPASLESLSSQAAYTVHAYDTSGTDISLARWYQLQFSINMEQSFSFTDDTQPTISRYDFYYSPPPTKRLMHGRDFRDQTQQGADLNL